MRSTRDAVERAERDVETGSQGALTVVLLIGSLGMGGAERQVIELGERLRSRGHRVAVLSLAGAKPQEWQTSLDVVRLGMTRSPIAALAALARAYRFLRGFSPGCGAQPYEARESGGATFASDGRCAACGVNAALGAGWRTRPTAAVSVDGCAGGAHDGGE